MFLDVTFGCGFNLIYLTLINSKNIYINNNNNVISYSYLAGMSGQLIFEVQNIFAAGS